MTTRAARVETGNRLAVQGVPQASYVYASGGYCSGCGVVANSPAGKALIVREVRVVVYAGSAGGTPFIAFYPSADCSGTPVGDVMPTGLGGPLTIRFEPGVAIPSGGSMSVEGFGGY